MPPQTTRNITTAYRASVNCSFCSFINQLNTNRMPQLGIASARPNKQRRFQSRHGGLLAIGACGVGTKLDASCGDVYGFWSLAIKESHDFGNKGSDFLACGPKSARVGCIILAAIIIATAIIMLEKRIEYGRKRIACSVAMFMYLSCLKLATQVSGPGEPFLRERGYVIRIEHLE